MKLANIYGPGITLSRGKVHDYLGMDLDYSSRGKVKISIVKYLDKIIVSFPEEITRTAESTAADHMFQTREEDDKSKVLPEEQARHFHHTVSQLLCLAMRARPGIKKSIAFLTKRVRDPDEDDWQKLKRVLKYLKGTRHMKLTLTVDNMNTVS